MMKQKIARRVAGVLMALISASAVTSCATNPDDAGGNASDGTVRLSMAPIATNAAYVLGVEKGFFEDEGIDLKFDTATSNGVPGAIAAMQSGSADVSTGATSPVLLAAAKGLPLTVLTSQTAVVDSPDGLDGDTVLMVPKGSKIRTVADLAGKKIAVNELTAQAELMSRAVIDANGGDSEKSTFVPIPFPAMVSALTSGQVDAMFGVEPLISGAKAAGAKVLVNADTAMPGAQLTTVYTTEKFASENPELVEKLIAAMDRSSAYAAEHPDEVRAVLGTYTEMPPKLADAIRLPHYTSESDDDATEHAIDLMVDYGFIDKKIDLTDFQFEGH